LGFGEVRATGSFAGRWPWPAAGRYLFVVAIAESEEAFIVTARAMTDAEKRTFHRKAR
jgi:hypothetical protein